MKIKIETLDEIFGEIETEERFEIILPFLKKIAELEEKNEKYSETIDTNIKYYESEGNKLKQKIEHLEKKIEQLEKDDRDTWNRVYEIRNIIESITKGISIDTLYEKIKGIGDLLNTDLSEQIGIIKEINAGFREGQKEIITLRGDKEEIKIKWDYLQKENKKLAVVLQKQNEENHRLEEEIDSLKYENEQLKSEKEKLLKNVDSMNREIEVHAIKEREYNEELREKINMLENENKRLNDQVVELQRENKNLREDIFRRNENEM